MCERLKLKPFQEIGVEFLTTRYQAILADDMGLGKTIQVIRALEKLKPSFVVIVCPASMKLSWYDNMVAQFGYSYATGIQVLKGGNEPIKITTNVVIVSYDLLIRVMYRFKNRKIDVLVCDESHQLRSGGLVKDMPPSKRAVAVLGRKGLIRQSVFTWFLTGTPIYNRTVDLYPVLATVAHRELGKYVDFGMFCWKFCGGELGLGSSCQGELAERLKSIMIRRTKQQVLPDLPAVTEENIYIEPNNHMRALIEEQDKNSGGDMDFGKLSRHRHQLAIEKIPKVIEYVREVLEGTNEKVMIVCHHQAVMQGVAARLSEAGVEVYHGGMSAEQKEHAKRSFINDKKKRIFIGQILSAGTGLDGLQKVCSTMIMAEWDWTPGANSQVVDRLNRMGQENPVTLIRLIIKGSLEEKILKSNTVKRGNISKTIKETQC
jgi:SWI/SNF-related matrix-associated actin-dependent regulator 1 of chromatin subfamily A